MKIAIIGGGIAGLSLALNLHRQSIDCIVFERAPELKELGLGITILPHAMREFEALGLGDEVFESGVENTHSYFFNRFGQLLYKEKRGQAAGYPRPEVGIHRGRLQMILYRGVVARLGADTVKLDRAFADVTEQSDGRMRLSVSSADGSIIETVVVDGVVACDGVNSSVRKMLYPRDKLSFGGINVWRGVAVHKPVLDGHSYIRVGSLFTGKMLVYPIVDNVDGKGNQLVNWAVEKQRDTWEMNDWNTPADLEDIIDDYKDWIFDWLDVPRMLASSRDNMIQYPMVDKEPVERWTFGALTMAGDAAHPMYPRGSNGAAQAVIDVRTLGELLAKHGNVAEAFTEYESIRLPVTSRIVHMNRNNPPDVINIKVEELVGDKPFENLDDYITQDEIRKISDQYKDVAGFSIEKAG